MRVGREIGAGLKAPALILLSGDLGAGKTTLTKGIVSGLGAAREEDVTSPTFTLVHKYEGANAARVYHVDLYRIVSFQDFETLGLEDVFSEQAVVIIEWSEKIELAMRLAHGAHSPRTRGRRNAADYDYSGVSADSQRRRIRHTKKDPSTRSAILCRIAHNVDRDHKQCCCMLGGIRTRREIPRSLKTAARRDDSRSSRGGESAATTRRLRRWRA